MLLTLNYDLFLEQSLQRVDSAPNFTKLENYIPSHKRWRLIKLHGSVNWGRRLIRPPSSLAPTFPCEEIDKLDLSSGLGDEIVVTKLSGRGHLPCKESSLLYPVLAIPIEQKYDFACPSNHLYEVNSFLKECKNFLIIGCSLKDQNIMDLLGGFVSDAAKLMVINGSLKSSLKTISRLKKVSSFNKNWREDSAFNGDFDRFLGEGHLERFLDF